MAGTRIIRLRMNLSVFRWSDISLEDAAPPSIVAAIAPCELSVGRDFRMYGVDEPHNGMTESRCD